MNSEDSALLSAFLINFGIGLGVFFLFCYLRNSDKFLSTYSPMCSGPKSAEYPIGFYHWILESFSYSQEWVLRNRGLDAVMYIRFQQSCLVLFSLLSFFAFITVVPTNSMGTNKNLSSDDRNYVDGLAIISMSNVAHGSELLWVNCLFLSFATFIFMFLQNRDHKKFSHLRVQLKKQRMSTNFSVIVKNYRVPGDVRTLSQKTKWLTDYFNHYFDNSVLFVRLIWNEPDLDELKEEEDQLQRELERAQAIALRTGNAEPQGIAAWVTRLLSPPKKSDQENQNQSSSKNGNVNVSQSSETVSLIDQQSNPTYYRSEEKYTIGWYKKELKRIRDKIRLRHQNNEPDLSCVAIVTFRSISKAMICAQTNMSSLSKCFMTSCAVESKTIVYDNLDIQYDEMFIRSLIVYGISFFLIFFYMIPITLIQTLANLRELADTLNWTWLSNFLDDNPVIESFFSGYISPLILVIFMAYLLPIMRYLSEKQGYATLGEIERSTLNKYFFFLVFSVFLTTTIAGSILNELQNIADDPSSIVSLFASSLPQQGSFFITYVMLASSQIFIKLLNPQRLILLYLKEEYVCKSEREYRENEAPDEFDFVDEFSNDLLIMQISVTYSVMFPIILPFAAFYFLLNLIAAKYRIVYMCEQPFEMGGILWPNVFVYMSVGMLITNVTMLGVFGIYEFPGSGFVIPLICLTILFTTHVLMSYNPICEYGALDEINLEKDIIPHHQKRKYEKRMMKDSVGGDNVDDDSSETESYDETDRGPETEMKPTQTPEELIQALPIVPNEILSDKALLRSPEYIRFWYDYVQPSLIPPGVAPLPPMRLNRRGVIIENENEYLMDD